MSDLEKVNGLGPKTIKKLNDLSINSIEDLLLCFPKSYKIQKKTPIEQVKINQVVSIDVEVLSKATIFFFRKNLSKLTFKAQSQGQSFRIDIFNRHYLSSQIYPSVKLVVTGRFKERFNAFTASDIVLEKNYEEGIIAQYQLGDIKDGRIKKVIHQLLIDNILINETLPKELLVSRKLEPINQLIRYIHIPNDEMELSRAIYRLKYEELILFALRIELIKGLQKSSQSFIKHYNIDLVKDFIKEIGFELTKGQKEATNEIFRDLRSSKQMNRLLQGDVGSGKTIVAVLASLAVVSAKSQVAIMAPTLVLAHQHYLVFEKYLKTYNVNIALLTSESPAKEKRQILSDISNHKIDIIIGTHALIQENIEFLNLGLAIIDEQHRFGVEQRKKLRQKGYYPDLLLMSATPIPRSLAISIFESSDISQITEKPLGRKSIITKVYEYSQMKSIYQLIRQEINLNHQVYVVCPLIEESQNSNRFSTEEVYQLLSKKFDPNLMDILHGKLSDKDKIKILNRFQKNQIKILVSTSLIEVGVHVDNATTMLIMNANTFGLAQLHQLRGRIGRSDLQSYCCLIVDDGLEDLDRLSILENTDDGFKISEYDLKLRGPGEVFGNNQAGVPKFNFANLIEDEALLKNALEDAQKIISSEDKKSKELYDKVFQTIESYHLD